MSAGFDVAGYPAINSGTVLRSAEECRYHQLLSAGVERPDVVLPMVARWASRPAAA
jgi:hypothetical protein